MAQAVFELSKFQRANQKPFFPAPQSLHLHLFSGKFDIPKYFGFETLPPAWPAKMNFAYASGKEALIIDMSCIKSKLLMQDRQPKNFVFSWLAPLRGVSAVGFWKR